MFSLFKLPATFSAVVAAATSLYLDWALILIVLLTWYFAFQREQRLKENENAKVTLEHGIMSLWDTKDWKVLHGLTEQYIRGRIPFGPWEVESMRDRWADKHYLKRLCRAGIVPLHIQGGGLSTYQTTTFKISNSSVRLPEHVQSKKRAYFDFALPLTRSNARKPDLEFDAAIQYFLERLMHMGIKRDGVAVSIWIAEPPSSEIRARILEPHPPETHLEYGATSTFSFLLPFKKDRVINNGNSTGQQELSDYILRAGECRLLELSPRAIIRVEARNYGSDFRPEKFVYQAAQEADLFGFWNEVELRRLTREWLRDNGIAFSAL